MESTKAGTDRVPFLIITAQIAGWLWIGAPILQLGEVYSKLWSFGHSLTGIQFAAGRGAWPLLCLLCECLFASALVMILARQNLGRIFANFSLTLTLGLTIAPIVTGLHDAAGNTSLELMWAFVINCILWFFMVLVPLLYVLLALNSSSSRKWLNASLTAPPVPPQG